MKEYLFDCKLFASVRVSAETERDAVNKLADALDCASINAGAWADGSPILFEASLDGEPDLIEINGHYVP